MESGEVSALFVQYVEGHRPGCAKRNLAGALQSLHLDCAKSAEGA
jgi:hypothetical protein